ncbi:MAG: hypothetical protein ACFE9Z_15040 [Promethearchaeota archaeon]
MIKFLRRKVNKKYKKEELIKKHKEREFTDNSEYGNIRRGVGCGAGR